MCQHCGSKKILCSVDATLNEGEADTTMAKVLFCQEPQSHYNPIQFPSNYNPILFRSQLNMKVFCAVQGTFCVSASCPTSRIFWCRQQQKKFLGHATSRHLTSPCAAAPSLWRRNHPHVLGGGRWENFKKKLLFRILVGGRGRGRGASDPANYLGVVYYRTSTAFRYQEMPWNTQSRHDLLLEVQVTKSILQPPTNLLSHGQGQGHHQILGGVHERQPPTIRPASH